MTIKELIDELSYFSEDDTVEFLINDCKTGAGNAMPIDAVDTFCRDVDSRNGWTKFDEYCDAVCQEAMAVCETKQERATFIASHIMNAKTRVFITVSDQKDCNDGRRIDCPSTNL